MGLGESRFCLKRLLTYLFRQRSLSSLCKATGLRDFCAITGACRTSYFLSSSGNRGAWARLRGFRPAARKNSPKILFI
jgi:hypothetical protein